MPRRNLALILGQALCSAGEPDLLIVLIGSSRASSPNDREHHQDRFASSRRRIIKVRSRAARPLRRSVRQVGEVVSVTLVPIEWRRQRVVGELDVDDAPPSRAYGLRGTVPQEGAHEHRSAAGCGAGHDRRMRRRRPRNYAKAMRLRDYLEGAVLHATRVEVDAECEHVLKD